MILLVKRGNCTFLSKTLIAQQAGASLLLVWDDKHEHVTRIRPYAKNAAKLNIGIPTLLIDFDEGKELFEAAANNKDHMGEKDKDIVVSVDFKLVKKKFKLVKKRNKSYCI